MQDLVSLGIETPNIVTNSTLIYGQDFTLSESWNELRIRLSLDTVEQVYMIWLWLDTAFQLNFQRNTTRSEIGFIGNIAGDATFETVTLMQLELPMFTYATQFNTSYYSNVTLAQQDCL